MRKLRTISALVSHYLAIATTEAGFLSPPTYCRIIRGMPLYAVAYSLSVPLSLLMRWELRDPIPPPVEYSRLLKVSRCNPAIRRRKNAEFWRGLIWALWRDVMYVFHPKMRERR